MYGNKFYQEQEDDSTEIQLRFTLKLHNITRYESKEDDPLTFLYYLKNDISYWNHGNQTIKIFLDCLNDDGTPLISAFAFLKGQKYDYEVDIEDNPNNPMTGTEDNPLEYQCTLTLFDFKVPTPAIEKCRKKDCPYKNYYGICRNHEDQLTNEEFMNIKEVQAMYVKILDSFSDKIVTFEDSYDLVGTYTLSNIDNSIKTVMIISPPKI
jgi:hypothetical protein